MELLQTIGGARVTLSPEIWIGLGGLVLHALSLTIAGIWQLSKVRADLIDALNAHRAEVHQLVADDRRAIQETLIALRQKINDVETDALKTFVRRDSFHEIMSRVSSENASFKSAIEAKFDRQDAKIDRLLERMVGGAGS
jgi:hypothetical protein